MSETPVWLNVPAEVVIRDIIESYDLWPSVSEKPEPCSVSPGDIIRPHDLLRRDNMSEAPEQQALKAAEEHVLSINTDLTRHALLRGWFGQDNRTDAFLEELAREDENFSKMEFSEDGHLVCGIHESRVIEHEPAPDEVWHVGITLYSGSFVMDEEFWIVYEAKNPLDESMVWVVEAE